MGKALNIIVVGISILGLVKGSHDCGRVFEIEEQKRNTYLIENEAARKDYTEYLAQRQKALAYKFLTWGGSWIIGSVYLF